MNNICDTNKRFIISNSYDAWYIFLMFLDYCRYRKMKIEMNSNFLSDEQRGWNLSCVVYERTRGIIEENKLK